MYFKARMSNHLEKWGNYLALGRVEVCVCVCVFLTGKKGGSFFNNVCLECYLACASDTECKRRVELIRWIRVLLMHLVV